ncbi:CU044_5270 family protein [Nonomuraea sp. NPDC046802]|uniref:CU044_5270 family protein n=1 Tax=Nonomuraea sp. NPDC046802 TaxID=3154919 RepID=UPI003404DF98
MKPIDELRAARPAHLGDRPVDERTRAVELARAMAGPREPRRRRRAPRPVWGAGLLGAAAAVTAVAVVMWGNGGSAAPPLTPRAPDKARSVASAPATSTVKLSAREVLLAAAEKADRQPEKTGDYWHTAMEHRTLYTAVKGGYTVVHRQRSEAWTPGAADGDQWYRSQSLGVEPATEEDRTAWQAAGSPRRIEVLMGVGPGKKGALEVSPRKARLDRSPLVDGTVFWLGRNITMKDLRGLPDKPDALKRWLLKSYKGHDTEALSVPMSADIWLFRVSSGLITDMPVTPQVRGAAFRMLAELDTVEVAEGVTDDEGRQGTAVAIREHVKGGTVLEYRLIFDEETGRTLGQENIVVKPAGRHAAFKPGEVSSSSVVIEAGWTDTRPGS